MHFVSFQQNLREGLAVADSAGAYKGYFVGESGFPGRLPELIASGLGGFREAGQRLLAGPEIDLSLAHYLPPFPSPSKIVCIGLNYADHSAESGFATPTYPTVFARFASSLVGHNAPMILPKVSTHFDYEGEVVAVIGKGGRDIPKASALDHVIGYSIFNDGSIRDYQFKSPQWTMGKNFDGTGGFGPCFVTADELPAGAKGLKIETRLNGQTLQSANTNDMVFDVASLVAILSEAMTLTAGDVIVTGTPAGVGQSRKPPLFMKPGDVCEVEVAQIGLLRNPIKAQT